MDAVARDRLSADVEEDGQLAGTVQARSEEVRQSALGRTAQRNFLPQQPGDMRVTHADVDDLQRDVGYRPTTKLRDGVRAFADWFCEYYGVAVV